MKNRLLILILFLALSGFTNAFAEDYTDVTNRDLSVLIEVSASQNPPSIMLKWKPNVFASKYYIYRKNPSDADFPSSPIAQTDSVTTEWTDTTAEAGKIYEYSVQAYSKGYSQDYTIKNRPRTLMNYLGLGYVIAGIGADRTDQPGRILLLIDSVTAENLPVEIETLKNDLWKEGWAVTARLVPRAENYNAEAVSKVKETIFEEYGKGSKDLTTILLLGRVPVAYSGRLNPDGHDNHLGAWPADTYYASTVESEWTDNTVNQDTVDVNSLLRPETRNILSDGKFDQSEFKSDLTFSVGRVDFYNMPEFQTSEDLGEFDLLKRYLQKDHDFRNGLSVAKPQALITESVAFIAANLPEGFASSGWRNFGSCLGSDAIKTGKWFESISTDTYMWAYGTGPGDPISAANVGSTHDYANNTSNAVFTMLMGSYFGDWDEQNNFLRAGLAGKGMVLTCAWAARPPAFFHHMAMGYPIGYSYLKSENNKIIEPGSSSQASNYHGYQQNYYYYTNLSVGTNLTFGARGIHQALMGDPTLKMTYNLLPQSTAINLFHQSETSTTLSWNRPDGKNIVGYNVYKSYDKFSKWEKLNEELVTDTVFTDDNSQTANIFYMVRPVCLVTNNSGSFYAESNGTINQTITSVADENYAQNYLKINPNPVINVSQLELNIAQSGIADISIIDLNGNKIQEIYSGYLSAGTHSFSIYNHTNGINIASGMYFAIIEINGAILRDKIIIINN